MKEAGMVSPADVVLQLSTRWGSRAKSERELTQH